MAKRQAFKKNLIAAALFGALVSPSFADGVLSFVPTTSFSGGVSFVSLAVNITGISNLYAYQYTVNFNPSVVTLLSAVEGSFLTGSGSTYYSSGTLSNSAGTLSNGFDTLLGASSGVSGSGTLQTLTFLLGPSYGVGTFSFSGVQFVNSAGSVISIGTNALTLPINVPAVPEPATYALFGLGLAGLAAWRRRAAPVVREVATA